MEEKYYNAKSCEELCAEVLACQDAITHLACSYDDKEHYLSPELKEAFANVAGSCEDFLKNYNHRKNSL